MAVRLHQSMNEWRTYGQSGCEVDGMASCIERGLTIFVILTLDWGGTHAQVVTETPEIVYSSAEAQPLRDKAAQLGTAVAIYEYLHNTIDYAPYHGSRSGSVNTLLGKRGSDVDIASSLIAMLRAQSIPARYAVGNVRMPAAQLTNCAGHWQPGRRNPGLERSRHPRCDARE